MTEQELPEAIKLENEAEALKAEGKQEEAIAKYEAAIEATGAPERRKLRRMANDDNASVRYWAAIGLSRLVIQRANDKRRRVE